MTQEEVNIWEAEHQHLITRWEVDYEIKEGWKVIVFFLGKEQVKFEIEL
jgi:hypothetical protein